MKIKNKSGFTLAELLIVVAIIAVLVAIAIPVFVNQLEKSKQSTNEANIRSAYTESQSAILMESATGNASEPAVTEAGTTVTVSDVALKKTRRDFNQYAVASSDKNSTSSEGWPEGVAPSGRCTANGKYTVTFTYGTDSSDDPSLTSISISK